MCYTLVASSWDQNPSPVCDQGMNRSQVMRVALTSVVERLGVDELGVMTPWVSRAHGAVSGCDAHTAYEDLDVRGA